MPLFRFVFAACLGPSFAFAACAVHPLADLPLTVAHQKLLLPVAIDGSPEQIALDTGAGITVISTEAANRLDILHDFDHHAELGGVGGADSMLYIGRVNRFDLGPLHLEHQRFPIVDLALRSDAGSAVAGFLGADILRNFDVEIDIGEGRLAIWPPATCGNTPPSWAQGIDPVTIDISGALRDKDATLFHPFTTTLVEIVLNRVPYPFNEVKGIFEWLPPFPARANNANE